MCGLVGILNGGNGGPVSQDLLARMIAVIRHRGPDETGMYLDPHVGLGHARLSIIGLEGGAQPISNEDGSLWIVYNGEVFNYIELKEDLLRKGHRFSTETDTEVILHLYEELGPNCLEKFNGQFALAIWDTSKRELFLARDRVGVRPLFFSFFNGGLVFSSEIKAIFLASGSTRIDPQSLFQVFTLWTTLTPKTIFEGVYELPPGHFMMVKDGRITRKAYWHLPFYPRESGRNGSMEEAEENLLGLLKDAVRLRLRADVPVGAYLSGGLDSSIISAVISRNFNNRLRTFSMSFEEAAFDETPYQTEMQRLLQTEHSQIMIDNDMVRDHFPDTLWHCEIPLLRTAPVPLYLLSRLVRDSGFKVVLTGEGADEVFGGYNIFKEAKFRRFCAKRPESRLRPLLVQRLYPYIFREASRSRFFLMKFFEAAQADLEDPLFSHQIRWRNNRKIVPFLSDGLLASLSGYDPLQEVREKLPPDFLRRDELSKAQLLEMMIFLSGYLLSSQGDRVAMANSLEIRLPYLDWRVIEFAARLPSKWKIRALNEKYILKRLSKGIVADSISARPKQPYRAPIREVFFKGGPCDYVEHFLSEECLKRSGYFNAKMVNGLVAKFKKETTAVTSEIQNMAMVGILSTQLIHDQFIENFPLRNIVPARPDKLVRRGM